VGHEVNPFPTVVILISDGSPSKLGGKVILTAHVEPAGVTGSVTFLDGPIALGSAPVDANGNATLSVSTLDAGKHDLRASYNGDPCHAPSISATYSQVVEGPPTAHVLLPNGGENLLVGSDFKITWTTDGSQPVPTVSIYLSRDNGATYQPIAIDASNSGSYVWMVTAPGTNTGADPAFSARIKVVAKDVSELTGEDTSDGPFSIYDIATSTVVTRLDVEPSDIGVTIRWAIADHGLFAALTLERSEAEAGPWTARTTDAQQAGELTVVTDRTAEAGRTYWYRLVGTTNAGATATFGPVKATAGALQEFALSPAWPNPTKGGLEAKFAVPRQATVRLSLLDLQGREVAVMAKGSYGPGRYQVRWDGHTDRGVAPAGMYFLQLQTTGHKLVQRVVVAR